jgi:succinyl-CoA synthetase beta subunit
MPKLLEHRGKLLLRNAGIATPEGRVVTTAGEARSTAEALGFPVAIKAQILAGKRGLGGGIAFANDASAAEAAARRLLGTSLYGWPITELLIETKSTIRSELYVAVISDTAARAPLMIVSTSGGVEIEEAAHAGAHTTVSAAVDMRRGAPVYWCLDLVRTLPLPEATLVALAAILARLYEVYRRHDCTLAEINPLAVTEGGLIALDARIAIDDDAVFRHPELDLERSQEVGDRSATALELAAAKIDENDHRGSAHFVQLDPDGSLAKAQGKISIGFDGIGTGVSMAVMDELVPLGFLPMNFCDTSGNPTGSKLYRITKAILAQPLIEGYVFASCLSSQQLDVTARGIIKAFKEIFAPHGGAPTIPCVFSFRGAWDDVALGLFHQHGLDAHPWVRVLGRDSTERELAQTFKELHERWRAARGVANA